MFCRAKACASRSRPMWWTSAPQQPSPFGSTTSTPWRLRSRIAASLKFGFSTGWAQPDRIATRPRRGSCAGQTPGRAAGERAGRRAGASASMARSRLPTRGRAPRSPAKGLPRIAALMASAEAPRIGQHLRKQRAHDAVVPGPPVGLLDIGPGVIDEVHVVHPRRAGRHAGEAGEAAVDVLDDLGRRRLAALEHVLDQVDAPARGIELVAQEQVGRAGRGAESAMHAGAQDRLRRGHRRIAQLLGGEVGLHLLSPSARHARPWAGHPRLRRGSRGWPGEARP